MHLLSKINTIRFTTLLLASVMAIVFLLLPSMAFAAAGDPCGPNDPPQSGLICGNCTSQGCVWTTNNSGSTAGGLGDNPIVRDIQMVVNFLSAGVGIVVVGVIILGGIQYMTAGDNPQSVSNARQRISNGLLALVAYIFTFAFLQWLIPGGIFK